MKKYLVTIGFSRFYPGDGMTSDDYDFYPEIIEANSPEQAERKAIKQNKNVDGFCGAECEREATQEDIAMWEDACEEISEEDAWNDRMRRWAEA